MAANPLTDPNWATETTAKVVELVGTVRDKTTTPVVKGARGVVFGLMVVLLGLFTVTMVLIGSTRGIQALFDLGMSRSRAVYASYFAVGGILCLAGAFLFSKRD